MKKDSLETRLGMFVGVALIAAFIILETIGGLEVFKPGYRIHAYFSSVQELTEGAPVKMAGVPVGRVERIAFADNRVKVTMKLEPGAPVKTDSKATIKFTGLMGQNFVAIDFGSPDAPRVENNATISSTELPDFAGLMTKLDNVATGIENLTKSFTGDKIDNLLGPLVDFVKQNREPLSDAIQNIRDISAQISAGKGTVGKLIFDDALYNSALATVTNIQDAAAEARLAVADARKIISKVNAGEGTLGKILTDEAIYRDAAASAANLREILEKINRGQGTAGKLVNDEALFNNAKATLQKIDKAAEGLEDQGPLSVLGIAVSSLF
ncbi:MAG: MlaD family protein [Verrucomicrobiae bacterium]|nr:MlaD family protein [Verrucomicrobiae bacterium]MCX7721791.1 MlaD family protein [Verrucomicrobiae bacterium]MDW7980141.1 MlaD family protein [Verrucomicrobiales bacterium]